MQLYNTATRQIEDFRPGQPTEQGKSPTVSLYTCGPTVYDKLTVGNWTAYIRWDLLARVLRSHGWQVTWIMNITDVGHLVSDADDGEDKLEKGARREGKTAWEVAEYYTADFIKGLRELNITVPIENLVKATDHIPEQIDLVKQLEARGHTYRTADGVYFDSTTFDNYGKLARLDIAGLQSGARVALGDKKHATDFAVWKLTPPGIERDMEWESPWGKGFPGWHLECSAMAMKYLTTPIDIHAGGIDHIPVHHTNEIAQSEAATGKPFVRFWVHSNFLTINGEKIAKSAGNGYSLDDLVEKHYSLDAFRLFVLESHYRTQSNFTFDNLQAAQNRLERWQAIADLRWQLTEGPDRSSELTIILKAITKSLSRDLDSPGALVGIEQALDILSAGISYTMEPAARGLLELIRDLLGIDLLASADITQTQKDLIQKRESARTANNYAEADAIRATLQAEGILLKDSAKMAFWSRTPHS